ncbi:hypothetical protein CBL_06564 [Carabus blaptoides fortunei]
MDSCSIQKFDENCWCVCRRILLKVVQLGQMLRMDTLYAARMHGFPNMTRGGLLPGETPFSEENILSLLIVLGSSISLVGLVFAFITYSLFSDLRNLSGTILMNMLAALFMTQLLYVIGVGGVPDSELCIALAFSLQYIRLSILCWMLCMTRHMYRQFQNNVNLRPAVDTTICRDFIKYSVFAWGLPGFLLCASIFIQYREKAGKLWDTKSLDDLNCWFLDNNAYMYGFLVPCCLLVLSTFSYLVRAAVVARYVTSMQVDKRARDKMRRKRALQLFLFTKLTLLLGSVVVLGACAKLFKSDVTWIAFNVGQGLQGILVAILVTCNCQVLKIYTRSIKSKGSRLITSYGNISGNSRGNAELSKSTSLQLLTWEPTPDAV